MIESLGSLAPIPKQALSRNATPNVQWDKPPITQPHTPMQTPSHIPLRHVAVVTSTCPHCQKQFLLTFDKKILKKMLIDVKYGKHNLVPSNMPIKTVIDKRGKTNEPGKQ